MQGALPQAASALGARLRNACGANMMTTAYEIATGKADAEDYEPPRWGFIQPEPSTKADRRDFYKSMEGLVRTEHRTEAALTMLRQWLGTSVGDR